MRPPIDIEFALKAVVGTASPVLGVITSFQEQIEWHLQILSLLVADRLGLRRMVRFSSYSWALVRHGVLPVSHGDARRHGCCAGILMESGKSVPNLRWICATARDVPPR